MNLARRLAMATFMISVVLTPMVGHVMLVVAGLSLVSLVGIWIARRFEPDDPYDLGALRDVDDKAEWETADPHLAPDADRLICPHCGEENDAARPFCRRCGAIQI